MRILLPLLLRHPSGLILGQTATDGARALGAEVERQVFLFLVEDAELRPLVGVNHCEHACDRFAEIVAVCLRGPGRLAWVSRLIFKKGVRKEERFDERGRRIGTFW